MNEESVNWKNDMDWEEALYHMIILEESKNPNFDGKMILPIQVYPTLLPICAYNCLEYIHLS